MLNKNVVSSSHFALLQSSFTFHLSNLEGDFSFVCLIELLPLEPYLPTPLNISCDV